MKHYHKRIKKGPFIIVIERDILNLTIGIKLFYITQERRKLIKILKGEMAAIKEKMEG